MKQLPFNRQRGVAVITALLLTTLAITIVASLFWQQQVQVRSIENQRLQLQKQWVLRGALDWARLILGEDKRIDASLKKEIDHLGEPWAVPLAETRLDQYVDKENANDVPDAALSGGIVDAQARYNLRSLAQDGKINDKEVARFGKLLEQLQINSSLALQTAILMQSAQKAAIASSGGALGAPANPSSNTSSSTSSQPMDILHVDDLLAVQGFTPEMIEKLKDFVIVLPAVTKININTAPAEVIAAKIDTLTLAEAAALVAARQSKPFLNLEGLPIPASADNELSKLFDVKTDYFLINGNVRLNRAGMEMQALIWRESPKKQTVVWIREY
jgi:general secretion pathway protein K